MATPEDKKGQYLLRVHEPGYQEPEAIELELAWLAAVRRDADLPNTWVAANLGMAGIFAPATPLVNMSPQIPLPPWTVVAWWAFAVMSALVAMLLLLLYEGWSVRRGYRAWTILAWGEGEVTSAPWRKLWWWIPLSYAALFGWLVASVFLQQLTSA